jgi:ribosomal protein S18 acetylase RimI-like enzyme
LTGEFDLSNLDRQPFDEGFLGGPVYRLLDPSPDATLLRSLEEWAVAEAAVLVIARVDETKAGVFSDTGFRLVERLITYQRDLNHPAPGPSEPVRMAKETDIDGCAEIAQHAFSHDRYHADPMTKHVAADIKAAWTRNDLAGRADTCFVAERDQVVAGFNLCLLRDEVAVIDLIATAPNAQRRGVGRDLVRAALRHYIGRATTMRVGTQASNEASLALYESEGFQMVSRQSTFHLSAKAISR